MGPQGLFLTLRMARGQKIVALASKRCGLLLLASISKTTGLDVLASTRQPPVIIVPAVLIID